ncbi:SpoIIE family protein phosphatase [Streptomyces sp. JNUCC 63]
MHRDHRQLHLRHLPRARRRSLVPRLHQRRPPAAAPGHPWRHPLPRRRTQRPARRQRHGSPPAQSTVLLYTDGLIERRGQDIDTGLHQLTDNPSLSPDHLADTLLSRLDVSGGGDDDIALIVVRL